MNYPTTTEEQIMKLANTPEVNRNWLEYEAYKAGVDVDKIRGFDDGEMPARLLNNEKEDE